MQPASRAKLQEMQSLLSKMPLEVCCVSVLPDFGVRWREVSRAVRNSRLPMTASSVARVLSRHAARSLPEEEVEQIVAKLRLKLIVTQERKWHVITLSDSTETLSPAWLVRALPGRVANALKGRRGGAGMRPEIESLLLGDLLYMSVQLVSETKTSAPLYVAAPPGEAVALVSSLSSGLLKACVAGLGYNSYEDAQLFGRDVRSLLRIHDRAFENVDHLTSVPEYAPAPVISNTGVDFTNKEYDEKYVEALMGPDPPLLTDLHISTTKSFFDQKRLFKDVTLTIQLKSDDVSKTLKSWVAKGGLPPTADFFKVFHKIKSNRFEYN